MSLIARLRHDKQFQAALARMRAEGDALKQCSIPRRSDPTCPIVILQAAHKTLEELERASDEAARRMADIARERRRVLDAVEQALGRVA